MEAQQSDGRWELYRVLSEPLRLRLLALASLEELAMGELAELTGESQSNVSRHTAPLRRADLLRVRRQGTRSLVRLAAQAQSDAVVRDALDAGRRLCAEDGSLERVRDVVRARDRKGRELFSRVSQREEFSSVASELPAYLVAVAGALSSRELAVDAGAGDGRSLDVLAPLFRRVVALDRSEAQVARAEERLRQRGYSNVELLCGEVDGEEVRQAVGVGADVVVAARMLHHAPQPRATLDALVRLAKPGGRVVVIDYDTYDDEVFRERQADVWMGFDASELRELAQSAGLEGVTTQVVPAGCTGDGPDSHLVWQVMVAARPRSRAAA